MKKIYASALLAMLALPFSATAGSGFGYAREQADDLFSYEITSPTAGDESFSSVTLQFPKAASVEYVASFMSRPSYIDFKENGAEYDEGEWTFPSLDGNTITLDLGKSANVSDRWEVTLKPGLFKLLDADENDLGTNPEMNIVITEGQPVASVDFSYTCDPADPDGDLLLKEMQSVTLTFTNLETMTANADAAVVTLGETTLDKSLYTISSTGSDNKVTVSFNPSLTTAQDATLTLFFPEGSLTGKQGENTDTNKGAVEISYSLVPPVSDDLTIAFYDPQPDSDGNISLSKFDSMLFFTCDNSDVKAVGGSDPNFTLKEVNGDYEQAVKLTYINGYVSGKSAFYTMFDKPVYNGEYTLTLNAGAIGDSRWRKDHSIGHTNAEIKLTFSITGGEDRPMSPHIDLSEAFTATEALAVKGVPSDDNIYWWANIIETSRYPGDKEMLESAIDFFKLGAETFSMDWVTVFQMTAKKGEYTWGFGDLLPQTDYTVYAFGLDDKGELYMPMAKIEVRTADPVVSDNTFTLEVVSVENGTNPETKKVTLKATPTNNDQYTAVIYDKLSSDKYDLTDVASHKDFLRLTLRPMVSKDRLYTGEQTIVFDNVKIDAVMQAAVFGFEEYETTMATTADFNTIDNDFEAMSVTAYDPTISGASATVYSFDMVRPFIMGVVSKKTAEEIGGIQNIHEEYKVPYWEAAGMGYYDWRYFAAQDLKRQALDGTLKEIDGVSSLKWDTDYILYAYLMDEGGYRTSPVYYDEFTTASRNKGSNTFELKLNSITSNAPYSPDTFTADLSIIPTDKNEQYALYYGETFDFEEYLEENRIDDWMYDVFMQRRVKKTYSNDLLNFGYGGVQPDGNYILIVSGFDEAPNTEPTWMLFNKDGIYNNSWSSVGVESVNGSAVRIYANGRDIYVSGEFKDAAVYTTDGLLAGKINGNSFRVDGSGCYIVRVQTADGIETRKVIIR